MSDLKEKKFGYIVNNQPCPGHIHPPYPPMPPPIPGVTMKDLIQYVNSYIDVRAKQIYEKIKEHQGGIDKQEIIDAVIAQIRTEIGEEVSRYISNHYDFEEMIRDKIQDMDFLTPSSSEFTQLKGSVTSFGNQITSLSAAVESLQSQMQNVVTASTLNQKLGSYATNNRVDGIDAAVSGLSNTVAALSNQVSDILGDWASVKERTSLIPGMLSDIASLKADASTFATKDYVDAKVGELSAAMGSYATNARVDGIDASVSAIDERVVVIESMLLFDDLTI